MSDMTCPKCQGSMRSYERNGVTVDQCTECRGIFLDRGELEHLVAADSRAHTPAPAAAPPPPRREEPRREYRDRDDDDDDRYDKRYRSDHGYSGGHGYSSKRKKHWVEDLFG